MALAGVTRLLSAGRGRRRPIGDPTRALHDGAVVQPQDRNVLLPSQGDDFATAATAAEGQHLEAADNVELVLVARLVERLRRYPARVLSEGSVGSALAGWTGVEDHSLDTIRPGSPAPGSAALRRL